MRKGRRERKSRSKDLGEGNAAERELHAVAVALEVLYHVGHLLLNLIVQRPRLVRNALELIPLRRGARDGEEQPVALAGGADGGRGSGWGLRKDEKGEE